MAKFHQNSVRKFPMFRLYLAYFVNIYTSSALAVNEISRGPKTLINMFDLTLYVPVNNFSVMVGRVFLG